MTTIKFYEIAELPLFKDLIEFDGDKTDFRLHVNDMYRWGAKLEKDYDKCIKLIDKIEYKGKGWQIYAGYDVSGYDYWMVKQEEGNYIDLTISFDNEEITRSELPKIMRSLNKAIERAKELTYTYTDTNF